MSVSKVDTGGTKLDGSLEVFKNLFWRGGKSSTILANHPSNF